MLIKSKKTSGRDSRLNVNMWKKGDENFISILFANERFRKTACGETSTGTSIILLFGARYCSLSTVSLCFCLGLCVEEKKRKLLNNNYVMFIMYTTECYLWVRLCFVFLTVDYI